MGLQSFTSDVTAYEDKIKYYISTIDVNKILYIPQYLHIVCS